jgi:D-arabinose 1-dehydrogenase-like Zn-dependent alcohol dehydrogenase
MAPSLPKTFKAAVLDDKGTKLVLKDLDLKLPGPGQILIKTLACGICHSDDFMRQGFLGNSFPRVPGHEVIGDIVAVGEGVTRVKEGERVGGPWHGGKSQVSCSAWSLHNFSLFPFFFPPFLGRPSCFFF